MKIRRSNTPFWGGVTQGQAARGNVISTFVPFFTTKPHGTGIGLPLAKNFVERNGGTITIANGVNAGTKVEVTLPRAA